MYDLEQKNYELISKKCNDYRLMSLLSSCVFHKDNFKLYDIELDRKNTVKLYAYIKSLPRFKEIEKTNNKNYQKKYRLMVKVKKILYNELDAYFITFTFNDKYINDDFVKNKRRVIRYLKNNCVDYVCNADIGSIGKRLHFHALVDSEKSSFDEFKYGFTNIKYIKYKSTKKISNYIDKFTNHALKDSTNMFKVISSRFKK